MDRQTDRHTHRQTYSSQYFATAAAGEVKKNVPFFTAHAMLALQALTMAIPSVCLSVRLSHAGIVSKRRHVARCSFHRWIAKCV